MINLKNLTKKYGDTLALNSISLNVGEGEILGFLGPNGAGKTTVLRLITGYLAATDGKVEIAGSDITQNPIKTKSIIGYMPEQSPLYEEMIVHDYLLFTASIRRIKGKAFKNALSDVIQKCSLKDVLTKPIHQLSKGYKQRVGIAQAILHDPKILILDEPTSGLDPNQIIEIRELIKELGKKKTLILSSHILQEVQAVCDRIVILNKGNIVADGTPAMLKSTFQGKAKLTVNYIDKKEQMEDINLENVQITNKQILDNSEKQICFEYDIKNDIRQSVYEFIKNSDIILLEMQRIQIDLEEVFINLTKEV